MTRNRKRITAILAALMVLSVAVGGALAASTYTVDTETTTTAYQSDVTDGTTIEFNGSLGSTEEFTMVVNATSGESYALAIAKNSTGEVYHTTDAANTSDAGGATGFHYFNATFAEGDLDKVPMDAGENVTMDLVFYNKSASSTDAIGTDDNVTIQVHLNNSMERSVQEITENATPVTVENESQPIYRRADFGLLGANEVSVVTVEDETVTVNGSETQVVYVLADSATQDPFQNVTEDQSDTGAFTFIIASVDADATNNVPMFLNGAPDWYSASDMGTYGVYDDGENTLTFHTEDAEFEDASSADFTFSSEPYRATDIWTVWNLAGGFDGAGVQAVMDMVM